MFQLVMFVLLILSCFGYMLLVRKTLSLAWEFVPVFVFSSIACVVFLGGLLEQLYAVSLAVMILGLLSLGIFLMIWLRQGPSLRVSLSIFQIVFLGGSFLFLLLLLQNNLTHYDNFSHWAIVLKHMLSTDAFPTADANLIDFKNYPLGVSSFVYYICLFAGSSQSSMLAAQGLLIFSCFYAMFGIITEKKRFLLYASLGLGLSVLSFFNLTVRINNLLVDFLLPIYALAMFAIIYRYRHDIKRACLVVLPLAGLLPIMKSTGIIFAALGLLFLIYMWLADRKQLSLKSSFMVVGTIIGSLVPYFGWSWRMNTVFAGVENKFDLSSSALQNEELGKTPEQMEEITSLFIKSSLDLLSRPTLGIIFFELLAIAASVFAVVVLKKKWNLWKVLIALNVVLLLYYAGILGLYLFSMPLDEAIWLAGFERYASSIVVLFVGSLVLCATIDMERSFHYRIGEVPTERAFKSVRNKRYYQQAIWACTAIAITILLSEYNGILSNANNYEHTLPHKVHAVTGDRWYEQGEEDHSKYLFYASDADMQVTNYYLQYIGRYFLYAPYVDGIVLFYEDNMNNLLSGYDYLVVVETDSDARRLLKKHYDIDLQTGIYEITKIGEEISLQLV